MILFGGQVLTIGVGALTMVGLGIMDGMLGEILFGIIDFGDETLTGILFTTIGLGMVDGHFMETGGTISFGIINFTETVDLEEALPIIQEETT